METATAQPITDICPGERYLTIKEVMPILNVAKTKAYEFVNNHGLWVTIKGIGRRVRYSDLIDRVEESAH